MTDDPVKKRREDPGWLATHVGAPLLVLALVAGAAWVRSSIVDLHGTESLAPTSEAGVVSAETAVDKTEATAALGSPAAPAETIVSEAPTATEAPATEAPATEAPATEAPATEAPAETEPQTTTTTTGRPPTAFFVGVTDCQVTVRELKPYLTFHLVPMDADRVKELYSDRNGQLFVYTSAKKLPNLVPEGSGAGHWERPKANHDQQTSIGVGLSDSDFGKSGTVIVQIGNQFATVAVSVPSQVGPATSCALV